jgi:hypothetical protein
MSLQKPQDDPRELPDWKVRLSEAIQSLPVSELPSYLNGTRFPDLRAVVGAAARHVEDHYREFDQAPSSFAVDRTLSKSSRDSSGG